jgi:hypothetical protein
MGGEAWVMSMDSEHWQFAENLCFWVARRFNAAISLSLPYGL